jgi:TolB-like protein/tetratricopeptide (TPR) repeat protein
MDGVMLVGHVYPTFVTRKESVGMTQESSNHTSLSHDVFVSYASQDGAVANSIVENLEAQGLKCWIAPRDVKPGAQYADAIVRAINEAKAVVLVLSAGAMGSSHVAREVERAASKRKQIVALRMDGVPLSPQLEYFLSESQWIDVPKLGMPAALAKLKEAVGQGSTTSSQKSTSGQAIGTKTRVAVAAAVVIGVGVAAVLGFLFWRSNHGGAQPAPVAVSGPTAGAVPSVTIPDKSIAVLPFTDMSEKKDQEYFGDGMAEEIIDLLAKVPDLRVPARTSSFYFKGKQTKVSDIARELNVTNVLEGSIRRSGDRIRVTAQLVRADTGYHLWSETYDRPLDDIFKVQDEIANAVVQALQITLMGGPLTRQKGGTQNLAAYQLYLRALSSMRQNTIPSITAAREDFNQAIKLDPDFGLAWAELSRDTLLLTNNGVLSPQEGYERARQQAQQALQVSPDLAEAHATLSNIHRNFDWDWAASAAEVRLALASDPTNPIALMRAGQLAYTLGRWDEAERQLRLALVRDPLFTIVIWSLGTAQYGAGQFADADATYRRVLELAPGFNFTRSYLGKTLLAEGKPEAALAMLQQANETDRQKYMPIVLQAAGRQAESDEALKVLITKFADTQAYDVAMNYAYRGDKTLAFQWLDRAYEQRDQDLREIIGERLFKNIADDPRYRAFLKKMNLPND